jgi:glucose-1-phosphate cytidylyltransferase
MDDCGERGSASVKVVLFCGGKGLRLSSGARSTPKPMVPIGGRPILWHIMRYYAHYGHRDFVLCLGHRADVIEQYIRHEVVFRDAHSNGSRWRITFVDTGLDSTIAERLLKVRPYLDGEEMFLANYGDVLTDAPLPLLVTRLVETGKLATFLSVRPNYNFHVVNSQANGLVDGIYDVAQTGVRINGGYFVFRREIFDYIKDGDELVEEPFRRLIAARQLLAYPYEGFWAPMDTLKDKERLEALVASQATPWSVWEGPAQLVSAGA